MMDAARYLLFLLFTFTTVSGAQTAADSASTVVTTENGFSPFSRIGKDLWIQASAPFHMSGRDEYWAAAGLVTTAALMLTDQGTSITLKEAKSDAAWIRSASPVITEFGRMYGYGVIGLSACVGFIASDAKLKETSYLASEALLTAGIWGGMIKVLTGRERPSAVSESGGEWAGPAGYLGKRSNQSITSFDSFPSGHTLTAFSIATVFAEQYSDHSAVPIACYTAATLVGVSRLTENAHWASDVFVGALLGYGTAREVVDNNPSEASRRSSGSRRVHLGWSFGVAHGSPTVQMRLQF